MTRAASNIRNPRAWITAQFAVANISSAILVSSNPTNLVLAGAFDIKFIDYTVNMVSPSLVELPRIHVLLTDCPYCDYCDCSLPLPPVCKHKRSMTISLINVFAATSFSPAKILSRSESVFMNIQVRNSQRIPISRPSGLRNSARGTGKTSSIGINCLSKKYWIPTWRSSEQFLVA